MIINQIDFKKKIYSLCTQIPRGKVSTYKIISQFVYGSPNYSRRVGFFLSRCLNCCLISSSQKYSCLKVHCYRVIKTNFYIGGLLGKIGKEQLKIKKEKLASEGVNFNKKNYLAKKLREKLIFREFKV